MGVTGIPQAVGDVASQGIKTVGGIVETAMQPTAKPVTFVPDRLDWPRMGVLSSRQIISELRKQRSHEKRLIKEQAKANIKVAAYSSPMFWMMTSVWGGIALFIYIVHEAERGKPWAIEVLSYIPDLNELLGRLIPDVNGGLTWAAKGVEWMAQGAADKLSIPSSLASPATPTAGNIGPFSRVLL